MNQGEQFVGILCHHVSTMLSGGGWVRISEFQGRPRGTVHFHHVVVSTPKIGDRPQRDEIPSFRSKNNLLFANDGLPSCIGWYVYIRIFFIVDHFRAFTTLNQISE